MNRDEITGAGASGRDSEHLLLRALARQPVERTPLWLMRQAGRYLPEYRALRARFGQLTDFFRSPQAACEATMQPLARYPLDAAIVFSDILTIPDAMGLGLEFIEGSGPRFAQPLRTARQITALAPPDPELELGYVLETVRQTRRALAGRVPLIGFTGSPWTLAAYMIEGRGGNGFPKALALLREQPQLAERLLDTLARSVALLLGAQARAGAQVLQIFDSWGGLLNEEEFQRWSLEYLRRTIAALPTSCGGEPPPLIIFVRDSGRSLPQLATIGCAAAGVDEQLSHWPPGIELVAQGNLDPALLSSDEQRLGAAVDATLKRFADAPGHIFNLGHGVPPQADPALVGTLVSELSRRSRRHSTANGD